MHRRFSLVALAIAVQTSPLPQDATTVASNSDEASSGCIASYGGSFGLVAKKLSSNNGTTSITQAASITPAVTAQTSALATSLTTSSISSLVSNSEQQLDVDGLYNSLNVSEVQTVPTNDIMTQLSKMNAARSVFETIYTPLLQTSPFSSSNVYLPRSNLAARHPQLASLNLISTTYETTLQTIVSTDVDTVALTTTVDASLSTSTSDVAPIITTPQSQSMTLSATPATATSVDDTYSSCVTLTLSSSMLHDAAGRQAYMSNSGQFVFDYPDAITNSSATAFSVCSGSLALGDATTWWECSDPDDTTVFDVYDTNIGRGCEPISLQIGPGTC